MKLTKLHVFDLDHTLLKDNCSFRFGTFLYRQKYFSTCSMLKALSYYARHKTFGLPLIDTHQNIFRTLFQNKPISIIQEHVSCFLEASLEQMFYAPALKRLKDAQDNQEYVVILSSSPQFLVQPIAQALKVNAYESSHYETDNHHNLSHISKYIDGAAKVSYVKSLAAQLTVPLGKVIAYSDSQLDLPLLKIVGSPIGVNPDKTLLKFCQANNWEII